MRRESTFLLIFLFSIGGIGITVKAQGLKSNSGEQQRIVVTRQEDYESAPIIVSLNVNKSGDFFCYKYTKSRRILSALSFLLNNIVKLSAFTVDDISRIRYNREEEGVYLGPPSYQERSNCWPWLAPIGDDGGWNHDDD